MITEKARIVLCNTCIYIKNYTLGECQQLERNFMIYEPLYHKYIPCGMYYDKESRILYIPRVDLWKIKQYLGEEDHYIQSANNGIIFKDNTIKLKYKPRDEDQKQALKFMIGLGEYNENVYLPQLSVNLSTGKGKTYCSIATIAYTGMKSVIITGSNTLLSQWAENIKEYTNLTDKDIFFISGSDAMKMILSGKSKRADDAKITLLTHGTIHSFCDKNGWDKLNEVFLSLGITAVFFDEAHTYLDNMFMVSFFTNVQKTYYVTATPARSDWRENRVWQLSFKNVPAVNLFHEDKDPHTDYIALKYSTRPSPLDMKKCKNAYGLDRNRYINLAVNQPNFWYMMTIVMDMVLKIGGRALFYIGTNDALLKVYKWMSINYPELMGDVGIFTSLVSKEDKMKEKEKRIILSTTKSAGLGEHIEHLKTTVVADEPFKSPVLARQTLGRTRDDNTMYIELVDMSFRQTKNFYYSKLNTFNTYAKSVSDTDFFQYELETRAYELQEARRKLVDNCVFEFHDERFFEYPKQEPRIQDALIFFNDEDRGIYYK